MPLDNAIIDEVQINNYPVPIPRGNIFLLDSGSQSPFSFIFVEGRLLIAVNLDKERSNQ